MIIRKTLLKSINFLVVIFIVFTVFPVKLNYSSMVIILLSVFSITFFIINKDKESDRKQNHLFIIAIPLFIYILGLINTQNIDYGITVIIKSLSFLAFPIIFYCINPKDIRFKRIIITYLISLFLLNLYLWYLFIYYFNIGEKFYMVVSTDIYHSTYLGMYNLFAFWICVFLFKKNQNKYFIFLAFFFILSAIITSARVIFILSIISLFISSFLIIKSKLKRIVLVFVILVCTTFMTLKIPSIHQKFDQLIEINKLGFDKTNYQSISSRFGKIEASIKLIKKNPIFGTGTGDLIDELIKEYKEMKFTMGYKNRYNPHNQFLENIAKNGVIGGGISLIAIYLYPLLFSLKKKNWVLVSLVLIFICVSLTESIFDVHKGTTYVTFWVVLLMHKSDSNIFITKK